MVIRKAASMPMDLRLGRPDSIAGMDQRSVAVAWISGWSDDTICVKRRVTGVT